MAVACDPSKIMNLLLRTKKEKERGEITGGQRRAMAGDDEKPSINRERSCCSNKRTRRDMSCCSNKRTRREIPSSPEQSSVSLNDLQPLLIEILHRLPSTQSAFLCKSVCKKWLLPAVGKCFGVRQGFLCLMELIGVGINRTFHIWKLKDYNNGEWSLEDHVSLDAMIPESSLVQEIVDGSENKLKPLGFHPSDGNIVYLHFQTYVISFNTRTKELKMAGKIPGERDSFCHGKVFHVELPLWPTPIAKPIEIIPCY